MSGRDSDRQQRESQRIISRVGQETEASMAQRVRNHMTGRDADPDDAAEVWGTRIGRVLSVVLVVVLIGWLASIIGQL